MGESAYEPFASWRWLASPTASDAFRRFKMGLDGDSKAMNMQTEGFLREHIPAWKIEELCMLKGIKAENKEQVVSDLASSLSDDDIKKLKEEFPVSPYPTFYLYRAENKMNTTELQQKYEAKGLTLVIGISEEDIQKSRLNAPPAKGQVIFRSIHIKSDYMKFVHDFIVYRTIRDKYGQEKEEEELIKRESIYFPKAGILLIVTKNMEEAEMIKGEMETLFGTKMYVLRFYEEEITLVEKEAVQLVSASLDIYSDPEIATNRMASKYGGDMRKSPRYRNALREGSKRAIYVKLPGPGKEMGCGLNLHQGKVSTRNRNLSISQIQYIVDKAEIMFAQRKNSFCESSENLSEVPSSFKKKPAETKIALNTLMSLLKEPESIAQTMQKMGLNLQDVYAHFEELVENGLLEKGQIIHCPTCADIVYPEDNLEEATCVACGWKGTEIDADKEYIYSIGDKKQMLRLVPREKRGWFALYKAGISLKLPAYELEEFDVFAGIEQIPRKDVDKLNEGVRKILENDDKRKHDLDDLTGMFSKICSVDRQPHNANEIVDILAKVKQQNEPIKASVIIKSARSGYDYNHLGLQVLKAIGGTDSQVIFFASTKPTPQAHIATLNNACLAAGKRLIHLDCFDITRILLLHKLICKECGISSRGEELCLDCAKQLKLSLELKEMIEEKKRMEASLATLQWDKEKGQLPAFKEELIAKTIKDIEGLDIKLKEMQDEIVK